MAGLATPLLVPAIRLDRDADTEAATALRRAREPWVAGFCLFGGQAEVVVRLTAQLRDAAQRPLFVASDMERGAGQQVRGLRVLPDAGLLGFAATPAEVETLGEITARDARSVGVDVIFAPVVDVRSEPRNPIVGNRSFGWDPSRVAVLGAAFARGVLRGGALPVAKHYPGHGATREDSHDAVPRVDESVDRMHARDLLPFFHLAAAGVPGFMTAHVAYPDLDDRGWIATFSRPILDVLRKALPHPQAAAVFTDALLMTGASVPGGETVAARRALAAGCDLLLYPEDPERVARGFFEDADAATLAADVERALACAEEFRGRITQPSDDAGGADADLALDVARRAVALAGVPARETCSLLVLDDDDEPGRGAVLARHATEAGVATEIVRVPRDDLPAETSGEGGSRTIVVLARVGAWKGVAGVSAPTLDLVAELVRAAQRAGRRAQVVWCTPRPHEFGIHVPGSGPDVERALAEVLFPAATPA